MTMKRFNRQWRKLSNHQGDFEAGEFIFSRGKEWKELPGSLSISSSRGGRRAKLRLYVDQNGDDLFTRDELIFKGCTDPQNVDVIDALMNRSGLIQLQREQSTVGACTMPTFGAVCQYGVRSTLTLTTDNGIDVDVQPRGRFRRETISMPVGPQSPDELDPDMLNAVLLPDLA